MGWGVYVTKCVTLRIINCLQLIVLCSIECLMFGSRLTYGVHSCRVVIVLCAVFGMSLYHHERKGR